MTNSNTAEAHASGIQVSKDLIAHDVLTHFQGSIPEKTATQNAKTAMVASTTYPATGSIASMVIYEKVQVTVTGGKTFDGSAWGVSFPGGGALFGDVYTDDINRLYNSTSSFVVTATPVYTAVYFYDDNGNYLGSFQAGSVSIVTGTGKGSGSWS